METILVYSVLIQMVNNKDITAIRFFDSYEQAKKYYDSILDHPVIKSGDVITWIESSNMTVTTFKFFTSHTSNISIFNEIGI